jgi:hypothetical protein
VRCPPQFPSRAFPAGEDVGGDDESDAGDEEQRRPKVKRWVN